MGSPARSRLVLASFAFVIAAIWCYLLPWLSECRMVDERLRYLEQRGIDPSAMFYTELDAMDAILDRIEGRQAEPPAETAR